MKAEANSPLEPTALNVGSTSTRESSPPAPRLPRLGQSLAEGGHREWSRAGAFDARAGKLTSA